MQNHRLLACPFWYKHNTGRWHILLFYGGLSEKLRFLFSGPKIGALLKPQKTVPAEFSTKSSVSVERKPRFQNAPGYLSTVPSRCDAEETCAQIQPGNMGQSV
jgi:hypothetical protein